MNNKVKNSLGNLSGKVLLASDFIKPDPDDVSEALSGMPKEKNEITLKEIAKRYKRELKKRISINYATPDANAFDGKRIGLIADEFGQMPVFCAPRPWIKEIEDYCASLSITPTDLLTQHRELMKKGLKTKKVRPDNNYGVYDRNKIKLNKEN